MMMLTARTTKGMALGSLVAAVCASVLLALSLGAQTAHAAKYAPASPSADGYGSTLDTASIHRGTTFTVGGNTYKVTDYEPYDDDMGEVMLVKYGSAKKTVSINTVTYKGEMFEVDVIGKNAFNNARGHKVTSVTLGHNVDRIMSKAFYGCKKLKTLNLARTDIVDIDGGRYGYYLEEINIGSQALKNAGTAKMKVKCGRSDANYRKIYKKALMKKGLRSSASVVR